MKQFFRIASFLLTLILLLGLTTLPALAAGNNPKIVNTAQGVSPEEESVLKVTDTVGYQNLTPGKEYTLRSVLKCKYQILVPKADKPDETELKEVEQTLLVDGKEIRAELVFQPDTKEGEVVLEYRLEPDKIDALNDQEITVADNKLEIIASETLLADGNPIKIDGKEEVEGGKLLLSRYSSQLTWLHSVLGKKLVFLGSGALPDGAPWFKLGVANTGVEAVAFRGKITDIGAEAFSGCSSLKEVTIPEDVVSIGYSAFSGCTSLEEIAIPEGVSSVNYCTFSGCTTLKKVVLSEGLTKVGEKAFYRCTGLKTAVLPTTVTAIEARAFDGTALESVNIPAKVEKLDPTAFYACNELKSYEVDEDNECFSSVAGVLFNKDGTVLRNYPPAKTDGSYTVPNGVRELGIGAFSHAAYLTDLRLPEGLEAIDDDVFKSCTALGSLTLPNSLRKLGAGAFYNCDAMTELTIPAGVKKLGAGLALDCDGLTDATVLNYSCVFDGAYTFDKCVRLHGFVGSTAEQYAKKHGNPFTALESQSPFDDVVSGNWYYDAVLWALNSQITAGTSSTTFSPTEVCTRAQVATFLWRANGQPEPSVSECPFEDVNGNAYYSKAVLWAVENGITNGVDETHFAPNESCNRGQVVTFLWRAKGSPEPQTTECPFEDVTEGYYYKAMLWAVENGITNGVDETHFAPGNPCTRAQVVTFLYRAFAE